MGTKSDVACAVAIRVRFYSNIVLSGSDSDQAHIRRIAISEFLMSVVDLFVVAARGSVFRTKTADPRNVEEGFGPFVPLSERSGRWIENMGFFSIFKETGLHPALVYVAFYHTGRDKDQVELLEPFYSYRWRTG